MFWQWLLRRGPWVSHPFLWVLLIPLVTLPATYFAQETMIPDQTNLSPLIAQPVSATGLGVCNIESARILSSPRLWIALCPTPRAIATLLPGLLNLLPALGLLSARWGTRIAAGFAAAFGAARLAAPVVLYAQSALAHGGYVLYQPITPLGPTPEGGALVSVLLWMGTLLASLGYTISMVIARKSGSGAKARAFGSGTG